MNTNIPGWMTPKRFFHITGICAMITAVVLLSTDGIFLDGASLSDVHQVCDLLGNPDWSPCGTYQTVAYLVGFLFLSGLVASVAPFGWTLARKWRQR